MKKIVFFVLLVTTLFTWSCSEESLDPNSIFDTNPPERSEFDKWLLERYTNPYNIKFMYKYDDKESDKDYNLVPVDYDKSVAMAKLVKYLWIDAYEELLGKDFIRTYCPKMIYLIGSPAYDGQGSVVLGTAEGGLKVTLYNVNLIDLEHINPVMLNKEYFKTIHHEFAHILHQNKSFSTDFNLISLDYQSASWLNLSTTNALKMGFISSYASSETQEDFVEIIAIYVTNTEEYWQSQLTKAGADGSAKILRKFAIVKDYLITSWNIDIGELRKIVLRRSSEVSSLDLKTLN